MAKTRRNTAIIIFIAGVAAIIALGLVSRNKLLPGLGLGAVVLILVVRVLVEQGMGRQFKAQNRANRGAVGEEVIGDILEQIGPDYLSIHDVESPCGNIDHIVIARQGGAARAGPAS